MRLKYGRVQKMISAKARFRESRASEVLYTVAGGANNRAIVFNSADSAKFAPGLGGFAWSCDR